MKPTQFIARGLSMSMCLLAFGATAADTQPPAILSISPSPDSTVSALTQVQITFDEQVTGVEAAALVVNDLTASTLAGSSNRWTFGFVQPLAGPVTMRLALDHNITDLTGNRFDNALPSSTWSYLLQDVLPPTVITLHPPPDARVRDITEIRVQFSEPVVGVDPSDLRINGRPASTVTGSDSGPYRFLIPAVPEDSIAIRWADNAGIQDLAEVPNPLANAAWSYTRLPAGATTDVVINEISAENQSGLKDEDGSQEDWVELHNRGNADVNLLGWSLTDDPEQQGLWTFPDIVIPAGGYHVVFASGKNRKPTTPGAAQHTSFRLNGLGEHLALFDASSPRREISGLAPGYPEQRMDISWGRTADGSYAYFQTSTPGAANPPGSAVTGIAMLPTASVLSGFFKTPFDVHLASGTFGSRIHYTFDGSPPTEQSPRYRGPLRIEGTAARAVVTLRATAFRSGMLPSSVLTHTYLFLDHVPDQPARPEGFPATWVSLSNPEASTSTTGDYAMDPRVVTNKNNRNLILEGLASLPTVSIVSATPLLFGNNGVYSRRHDTNQQPIHVELIHTNGSIGFRQEAGLEIQGGSSTTDSGGDWKSKNLSMRILFKGDFGPGTMVSDLYEGSPVAEFDTLVLDAGLNMVWNHMTDSDQRQRGQYAREQLINDMMQETGILAPRGRFVHLYMNGLYWGIKNLHERPDSSWASRHLGGAREEYDVFKHASGSGGLQEGTVANYNAMLALARSGLNKNSTYEQLQQHVDVDWLIRYMLVNLWGGNTDWDHHNWYAVRRRTPGAEGWRFISWDAEHVLKSATEDRLGTSNAGAPSEVFSLLRNNPEFRLRFADHVHKHFFNGGIFYTHPTQRNWDPAHPEHNRPAAAYMKIIDQIDPAIVAESARWGDVARPAQPYTRDVEWLRELNALLYITNSSGNTVSYFPTRSSNVLRHLLGARLYPNNAEAPAFSQHGGRVPQNFSLLMSIRTNGAIYYTLDGSDPRSYGSGDVSPRAILYATGSPVPLMASVWVKARTLNGTNWSALNEAYFTVNEPVPALHFTEIMYRPLGGDAHEFFELSNVGRTDIPLSEATIDGTGFIFDPGVIMPPGAVWVFASAADTNAWKQRYPGVPVRGSYPGSLANNGERLSVKTPAGVVLTSVSYNNKEGWPEAADGHGPSLERIDLQKDADDPSAWKAGVSAGGTPGLPSPSPAVPVIRFHEIRAAGAAPDADFVELLNTSSTPVSLAGWSLTDDDNERKFVFPPGTSIEAGGLLVVFCDSAAGPGLHSGFGLDRDGDQLHLHNSATNRVDALTFGAQVENFTLGRVADRWMLNVPSPGNPNIAASEGTWGSLHINEWLPNAGPGESDWLELFNGSPDQPLNLTGLVLSNGSQTHVVRYPTFVAANGFLRLFADELAGPTHLHFRLPAEGGELSLMDPTGALLQKVAYAAAAPGLTYGRLPDGAPPPFVAFPGSASPTAPNHQIAGGSATLSEIMAWNRSGTPGPGGVGFPDWIELHNAYETNISLADHILLRQTDTESRFVFPAGSVIQAGGYLRIWSDPSRPASISFSQDMNTGTGLPATGARVALMTPDGRVISSVSFGFQIADRSIGRTSGGDWALLAVPTPNSPNSQPAALGNASNLRINEWMASPASGDDWVELHNLDSQPVALGGIMITDDPSLAGLNNTRLRELGYIGGGDYAVLQADGHPSNGPEHTRFSLDSQGEVLRLHGVDGTLLDEISFGPQSPNTSEGRFPDGNVALAAFPFTASPGEANFQAPPNLSISEVQANPAPAAPEFVEIQNTASQPISIAGWYLSDRGHELKRFLIPSPASVPANGFLSLAETLFGTALKLDSANESAVRQDELNDGDEVYLSEANQAGELTGYRLKLSFGASDNLSWGRVPTSTGDRVARLNTPSPGTSNSAPSVSPLVISEILPDGDHGPGFVEFLRPTGSELDMRDPSQPTVAWRVRGGLEFEFPPGFKVAGHSRLLIVGFDPATNAAALSAFRTHHGLGVNQVILGPWRGRLGANEDTLRLEKPSGSESAHRPGAGAPVYVAVEEIHYATSDPWPSLASGNTSLQRRLPGSFGNEPLNWFAATPTAGRPNVPETSFVDSDSDGISDAWETANQLNPGNPSDADLDPDADGWSSRDEYLLGTNPGEAASAARAPVIVQNPGSLTVVAGSEVALVSQADGSGPLTHQWWFRDRPIPGASEAALRLFDVQSDHRGDYFVVVGNAAGSVRSATALLTVQEPPDILSHPQSLAVNPGSNVTLRVVASTENPPLRYQWLFNGSPIANATDAELPFTNTQLPSEGDYAVRVADAVGQRTSLTARLTVRVKPVLTAQPTPTNQVVAAGDTVQFQVSASGSLPMTFRWRRGTGSVYTNITVLSNTCVFTLQNVTTNLAGLWSVSVTNSGGITTPTYSSNVTLVVLLRPTITRQPADATVDPGSSASFNVAAQGTAPLSYQWFHGANPIVGATATNLVVNPSGIAQQGNYSVVITNAVGKVTSRTTTLTIRLPQVTSIEHEGGSTFLIRWTSIPGRVYQLEYLDSLGTAEWKTVAGDIAATAATSSKSDTLPTGTRERYYRIVLTP